VARLADGGWRLVLQGVSLGVFRLDRQLAVSVRGRKRSPDLPVRATSLDTSPAVDAITLIFVGSAVDTGGITVL